MSKGVITIEMEGTTFDEVERCREIIMSLFEAEVFNIKAGKATLGFDADGLLQEVDVQTKTFKRNKPPLPKIDKFNFEISTQ